MIFTSSAPHLNSVIELDPRTMGLRVSSRMSPIDAMRVLSASYRSRRRIEKKEVEELKERRKSDEN